MYIGIDLGTSSVKMILCDEKGNVINAVKEKYPIYYPCEGYSEQNPEDWYKETLKGLKALTRGYESKIKALSIAGQMHALVMLDENDAVIRNAILWNDSRSVKECEYLNEVIGREAMNEMTGNIAFPGFTAPKIMWVREHERENFDKCRKIMLAKDYLIYNLTGEFVTDVSDASGMLLFDVKNRCYSKKMLELCQINEKMLPRVCESCERCGYVKRDVAESLGWGEVCVAAGGGDNAVAAVGLGVVKEGMCSVSLGTSGTVFIASDTFGVDGKNALHSFCHANGRFHLMGCILSAASCNKWWIEEILKSEDYTEIDKCTLTGDNTVVFLPYLMGERSPHNDVYARGAFVGMSADTKREDMGKAVLEGVCYALKDCAKIAESEGIEISEVRVCGGGAKSRIWCEMLANILKLSVVRPVCDEGPAFGAAILAMVASGEYKSVDEACEKIVKMKDTITYNEEVAKRYEKGYERFTSLYRCLKGWYREQKQ